MSAIALLRHNRQALRILHLSSFLPILQSVFANLCSVLYTYVKKAVKTRS
nr:MAG TPA: hypothetical protein [Caudoviricetes sp.]